MEFIINKNSIMMLNEQIGDDSITPHLHLDHLLPESHLCLPKP